MVNDPKSYGLDKQKFDTIQNIVAEYKTRKFRKTKDVISLSDGDIEFLGETQLGDSSYKFCPHCVYNGSRSKTFSWSTIINVISGQIGIDIAGQDKIVTLSSDSDPYVIPNNVEHYISQLGEEEAIVAVYTSHRMSEEELS
jgi:hypothetical protein